MKVVRRIILATCALLAALLLLVTALVVTSARRDDAASSRLGREAPRIGRDGVAIRDRNKNGEIDPYEDPAVGLTERVDDLLERMNLAEKAGLLFQPRIFMEESGRIVDGWGGAFIQGFGTAEAIVEREIRHFNLSNASDCRAMAEWHNRVQRMAERTRLGIPVTISTDPRHGVQEDVFGASIYTAGFSHWPEPLGLAATRDPALVRRFGEIANQEYRAVGLRTALHPVADLATEPRWARAASTFGEEADLASEMVAAYVQGFQGAEVGRDSILCMTKHFPGGGPQEDGLDAHFSYGANQVYPGGQFAYHLEPFRAALDAGTAQIMPYYGVPVGQTSEQVAMSFNREIITDLLRDELGFDGVVCTDWQIIAPKKIGPIEIMHPRAFGVEELSVPERYAKALEAGVDQFGGEEDPHHLVELVRSGTLSEARLDASVRRLLRDKFRLGLFDDPYVDADAAESICGRPEFTEAGRDAQQRSIVLLQNDAEVDGRPLLPLDRDVRLWIENVDPSVAAHYGTVVPELADADVALVRIRAPWEDVPPRTLGDFLFNVGLHQGDLAFPAETVAHLDQIARTKPTIVAVYLERPAVLSDIAERSAGLLAEFGVSDEALLDVVFGRVAPRGKLPVELPSSMEAVLAQQEDVPHDSEEPLFPFGHGLTYDKDP